MSDDASDAGTVHNPRCPKCNVEAESKSMFEVDGDPAWLCPVSQNTCRVIVFTPEDHHV